MKIPLLSGSALSRRQFMTYTGAAAAALTLPAAARAASTTAASPSYPGIEGVDLDLLMWDGGPFMDQMLPVLQQNWTALGGGKLNYRRFTTANAEPVLDLAALTGRDSGGEVAWIAPANQVDDAIAVEADIAALRFFNRAGQSLGQPSI